MALLTTHQQLIEDFVRSRVKDSVTKALNIVVDEAVEKLKAQICAEAAAITTEIMLIRPINSTQDKIEITIHCPPTRIHTNA